MTISSIQSAGVSGQVPWLTTADAKGSRSDVPFSDLLKTLVHETNAQQHQATESVQQLITGETESIHDVVLTASRADLAFRLMMEIRNRLIASWQEVMRMQV